MNQRTINKIALLLLALSTLAFSATRRIDVDVLTSNSLTDGLTGLNEIKTENLEVGTVAHVLGDSAIGDTADFYRQWNGSEWTPLFIGGGVEFADYPTSRPLVLVAYGQSNTIGVDGVNSDIDESEDGLDEINPRVWVVSRGAENVRVGSPVNLFAQSINSTPGAAITRYQATADKTLMTARQPLPWARVPFEASVSFVFPLAKMIQESEGRDVIIVPCAVGSSGYANGAWSIGDPLYEDMVERTNAVIEEYNAELYAIVGQQGEADNNSNLFTNNMRGTMFSLRSVLKGGTNTPIVLGSLRTSFTASNNALLTVADWFSNFVIVNLNDLNSDPTMVRDNAHWSLLAQRTVLPQRFFDGIAAARVDVRDGTYTDPISDKEDPPTQIELVQSIFTEDDIELFLPLRGNFDDLSENNFIVTPRGGISAGAEFTTFDRSLSQAIDIPEVPRLSSRYTKMFWVRLSTVGSTQHLLSAYTSTPFAFIFASSNLLVSSDRGDIDAGGPVLSNNRWTHVAVTYNSATDVLTWYINGFFIGSVSGVAGLDTITERQVRVGNSTNLLGGVDGDMRDIIFLDSEITQAELNQYLRVSRP